jgi:hypothetical protein
MNGGLHLPYTQILCITPILHNIYTANFTTSIASKKQAM